MITNRAKQFWHALFSKVGSEEKAFINNYLDSQEQKLFYKMDIPTQTHCIRVAQTCLRMIPRDSQIDCELLIRAALLHDIGKPADLIKTIDRVFIVLISTFVPGVYKKLVNTKLFASVHLIKALQAHAKHSEQGGLLAKEVNMEPRLVYLIENHHKALTSDDPLELKLLKQADNLN